MIFLTGATGFLGRQLLARLLVTEQSAKVGVLVRPKQGETTESRIESLLKDVFERENVSDLLARIVPIEGDVSLEFFGLGAGAFAKLATQVTTIYHSAACTILERPIEESRRVNVGRTKHVVQFAEMATSLNPQFTRLHHISTAFVAGEKKGIVTPEELSIDHKFRNSYERAKAEAEALVRAKSEALSYTIYRPSIIVGDSVSGQTTAFNVLYVPARLAANGLFKAIPALPRIPFDVVPVDYVADAIFELSKQPERHHYFHICAGVGRETNPKEILDSIIQTVNRHCTKRTNELQAPPLLSPDLLIKAFTSLSAAKEQVRVLEQVLSKNIFVIRQLLPFIPYMISNPRFDTSATSEKLSNSLNDAPLFVDYAENVFRFCLETNWGKNHWTNPNNVTTWARRIDLAPA